MQKIILYCLILLGYQANSQNVFVEWQKLHGGSLLSNAQTVLNCQHGGYLVVCSNNSSDGDVQGNLGEADFWIYKLSSSGEFVWQKNYGGSANDFPSTAIACSDGGYLIAGETDSNDGDVKTNNGTTDAWVIKIDSIGTLEWEKTFGGNNVDVFKGITATSDGNYILVGYSDSQDGDYRKNKGFYDCIAVKISSTGKSGWVKTYGGSGYDEAYSSVEISDGNFIIAGYSESKDGDFIFNNGGTDGLLLKINKTNGNIIWQKSFGKGGFDYFNQVKNYQTGLLLIGNTDSIAGDISNHHGESDVWILQLDEAGEQLSQNVFGGSLSEYGNSITLTSDGGILAIGYTNSIDGDIYFNNGAYDFWALKFDSLMNLQWEKTYGTERDDIASCSIETPDNGYLLAGYSNLAWDEFGGESQNKASLIKLNSNTTAVEDPSAENNLVASTFTKNNIYPNPCQNEFQVKTYIAGANLLVVDMQGKLVLELLNPSGEINVSKLETGLYFVSLVKDGKTLFIDKLIKE